MNQFSKRIAVGVGFVLLGVAAMFAAIGFGVMEPLAAAALFPFLVVAVAFFVIGGMHHEAFIKKYPEIQPFYTEEEQDAFQKKFPVMLVAGISVILFAVIYLFVMAALFGEDALDTNDQLAGFVMSGFMLFMTAGVPILVYAGMQHAKYDVPAYNQEHSPEGKKEDTLQSAICGCIMLTATIIFFIWGFVFQGWKICWVTYPIGGMLCGVVSLILEQVRKKS